MDKNTSYYDKSYRLNNDINAIFNLFLIVKLLKVISKMRHKIGPYNLS